MKTKIFLLLLIAGISASAQNKGFSLEPSMGFGLSNAVAGSTGGSQGEKAGIGLVYMFGKHWGISSGLQVQRYNAQIDKNDAVNLCPYCASMESDFQVTTVNTSYNFNYIELPLLFRFVTNTTKKVDFFAEAGVVLGYFIQGSESGAVSVDTTYGNQVLSHNSYPSFGGKIPKANMYNLQAHLALGVIIPFSRRCSVITGISLTQGFVSVGNSSNDIENIPTGTIYYYNTNIFNSSVSNYGANSSWLLTAGLHIKLGTLQADVETSN